MLFFEGRFLVFLVIVVALLVAARRTEQRVWVLLLASYAFYAAWDPRFVLLIAGSTSLDYFVAGRMRAAPPARRRALLVISLLGNLGSLAVFKYLDFGIETLRALLGTDWALLELTLPVGISFYTFQSMSYTIEVYRGSLQPEPRFSRFALFVSFFPQLVAGPIIRASDFLPQIDEALPMLGRRVSAALPLFVLGLFKKVVVADQLGLVVDPVFARPEAFGAGDVVLATLAFSGQIYCDFSGYTDMALALGAFFGFRFPQNFRSPYLASGPQDFWRRWHVSLSGWLRDYLYIPLGGSRHGAARTTAALMGTMLLGGLWHGAAVTFLLWGGFHGALLVGQRVCRAALPTTTSRWLAPLGSVAFFPLTLLGWLIFRSESMAGLGQLLGQLADPTGTTLLGTGLAAAIGFIALEQTLGELGRRRGWDWPRYRGFNFAAAGIGLVLCTVLKPAETSAFIYFQF